MSYFFNLNFKKHGSFGLQKKTESVQPKVVIYCHCGDKSPLQDILTEFCVSKWSVVMEDIYQNPKNAKFLKFKLKK